MFDAPADPGAARTATSRDGASQVRTSVRIDVTSPPVLPLAPSAVGHYPFPRERFSYAITYDRIVALLDDIERQIHIGPRVRALREAMDLSLRDLAERSGVSAPMLSQVERGETSPTLQVASRIAAGLDLRLSQLLRLDEDGIVTIVRREDRRRQRRDGHAYEVLTPPLPGQRAEVTQHTLQPGSRTGAAGDPPMHEPGSRETIVVTRGAATFVCDGVEHPLSE